MFTLLLRHGEKRVIDVRSSRRVAITSVSPRPVVVEVECRTGGAWVPLGGEVRLAPRASWSRGKGGIPGDNLAVSAVGAPGAELVRVSF